MSVNISLMEKQLLFVKLIVTIKNMRLIMKCLIGDLIKDFSILKQARSDAFEIVSKDPYLTQNTHQKIRQKVLETFKDKLELISIG